jgi:hypothetical protein
LELCPHHSRQQQHQKQRHNDATAAELLGDLTDFSTPDAVNLLLGNLVRQLARKRIQRRDAMAIAYVSQLLLSSIDALERHGAFQNDPNVGPFFFTRPAELDSTKTNAAPPHIDAPAPISDTARIAALYTPTSPTAPQKNEGRA